MKLSELSRILDEFNFTNSRNNKVEVFNKYKENPELIQLFHYAYDKLTYTFGISYSTVKTILKDLDILEDTHSSTDLYSLTKCDNVRNKDYDFDDLKILLDRLALKEVTGNAAKLEVIEFLKNANTESAYILSRVIDRDLKIGFNILEFNKNVNPKFKIFIPPYMRCSLLDKVSNVRYPAILQVKMDGTYRTIIKEGDSIETISRQGEQYVPSNSIKETFKDLPDGYYIGELMVNSESNRAKANGLLNSLEVQEDVSFYCWDVLTHDEFYGLKKSSAYSERFKRIPDDTGCFKRVRTTVVNSYDEVINITKGLISSGEEGSVLKDMNSIFENKTSKYQIKIKPEFDIEVRCTGFNEGKGRREATFGSMKYETDDGLIRGQVGSFTDKQLKEISENRDYYTGKIFTLKGNAITKSEGSESYAVQYPRFVEFRTDKIETDTYERAREIEQEFFKLKDISKK